MVNHHQYWWRLLPQKELTQVYLSAALRSFAVSLLGLFLPLYLHLDRGYSIQATLGFFILYSVSFAVLSPVAAKFASKYGVKHTVLFGIPFYLLFVLLLYLLGFFQIPLIIIAMLVGTSQAFYWLGMHMTVHHASTRKHRGEAMGKNKGINILATMIGPLIGGFLIAYYGFPIVFLLASIVLTLSGLSLFLSHENHTKYEFNFRSLIDKEHWKFSLFFVSRGSAVIAAGVIWPLFIYFILNDYFSLGIVGSLLSVITFILLWLVGKYSDHSNKRKIIKVSTIFDSIVWVVRGLIVTIGHVYAVTIAAAVTNGIREAPLSALEYDNAHGNTAAYFVNREIYICLGRILMLSVVLVTNNLAGGLMFQGFLNFAAFLF
tara:strand:- start:37938 stop:39062 length:1125 start_codon:yes stop_codon:yes gene_type:complete